MVTLSIGVRLRAAGLVIVPPREAPRDKVRAKVSLSEAITVNALKRKNIRWVGKSKIDRAGEKKWFFGRKLSIGACENC
jgi:hypothetical protein